MYKAILLVQIIATVRATSEYSMNKTSAIDEPNLGERPTSEEKACKEMRVKLTDAQKENDKLRDKLREKEYSTSDDYLDKKRSFWRQSLDYLTFSNGVTMKANLKIYS